MLFICLSGFFVSVVFREKVVEYLYNLYGNITVTSSFKIDPYLGYNTVKCLKLLPFLPF